jgi:CspA family cold shock protein
VSELSFAGNLSTPAADGEAVRVRVKWFNVEKGFGFVTPLDGRAEAFLHASVLSRGGVPQLSEGAELLCEVADGPKGPQVTRVVELLAAAALLPDTEPDMPGTVKWYQADKGFGFVTVEDGGRDIFLHKSALKRSNLDTVQPGQRVRMSVLETAKGREVRVLVVE